MKGIIEPARKKYEQKFGGEAPTIKFDSENFLPPPPGECGLPSQDCGINHKQDMQARASGLLLTSATLQACSAPRKPDKERFPCRQERGAGELHRRNQRVLSQRHHRVPKHL